MSKLPKPTDAPDINEREWWWMRFKMRPRGKWNVMLIRLTVEQGTIHINPFQDNNYYPLKEL
ncbi:MAG TPA: hypothetical protein VL175_07350 [Pirellulales bacterium]|jgi:hypothetical protein|nr:hypothetical protein [Pirellulales bacterium]